MALGIGATAVGAGIAAAGGMASTGLGLFGSKKKMNQQININNQAAQKSYEYGEMAANNAHQRQLDIYNRTRKDNSIEAIKKQYEEAGMNPASIAGMSGAGGAGQLGGGKQGTGAQVAPADAPEYGMLAQQALGMTLQNELTRKQIQKTEAEKDNIKENTETEKQSREPKIELSKQLGQKEWYENLIKKIMAENNKESLQNLGEVHVFNNRIYGEFKIADRNLFTDQMVTDILNTKANTTLIDASKELTDNKAKGYFRELLNETAMAHNDRIRTLAQKLATEHATGEYKNWKTWVDTAAQVLRSIIPFTGK